MESKNYVNYMENLYMSVKSKERIKKNGEVFTPRWLIDEMLDKFPEDAWEENKTWLEPAAGDGNIIEAIIERRVQLGHDKYKILSTTYAVELMADNVEKMKGRILKALRIENSDAEAMRLINKNIRQGNFLLIENFEEFFDEI